MNRADRATTFSEVQRIHLVERDLDEFETELASGIADLRGELTKIKGVLLGLLISVTTAALLLAINLVVSRGG